MDARRAPHPHPRFRSQYTQLIARRVREQKVYCEIHPFTLPLDAHPRACAARHHAVGRAGLGLRRGRRTVEPRALRARRAGARHLLRRAAHRASCSAARWPGRASASTAARTCASTTPAQLFARLPAGDELPVWMSPRRPRRGAAAGLRAHRRERTTAPFAAVADAEAQNLRRAVPPRGGAHAARRRDARPTSCSASAAAPATGPWPSFVDEAVARIRDAGRAERARHVRAVGRRRFGGGGGARPPRHRRAADLHLRRQRPAARRASARRSSRCSATPSRPTCAWSTPARGSSTSWPASPTPSEAEDHRRRVHRGLRGGGQEARSRRTASTSWRRARSIPTSSSRSRQGPVGDDQEPPQRRRPARADEPQAGRAAARAVQGRGARAGRRAGAAATTCCGASRSPGRAWPCASSAR